MNTTTQTAPRTKTIFTSSTTDENTYDGVVTKGPKMWVRVYGSERNNGACPTVEQVKEDWKNEPETFRRVR
jgi:hypothetical protein